MLWNNNRDDEQRTSLKDKYDFHPFAGLWSGAGELLSKPGQYYVQANWKGNGLANTGLGYMADSTYRDPFSAGKALASLANLNRGIQQEEQDNNNSLYNILGRLSTMEGNIGNWSANLRGRLNKNKYGIRGDFPMDIA